MIDDRTWDKDVEVAVSIEVGNQRDSPHIATYRVRNRSKLEGAVLIPEENSDVHRIQIGDYNVNLAVPVYVCQRQCCWVISGWSGEAAPE